MTWLAVRALRARNRVLSSVGLVLSSLVALSCILVIGLAFVGFYKINFPSNRATATNVRVAGTLEQVARGARFAEVCGVCHSPNGKPPLIGHDFWEGGQPPQTLFAANLTSAGEIRGLVGRRNHPRDSRRCAQGRTRARDYAVGGFS